MKKFDVVIVGGGIVGLTLAALLSKNYFSVALIESKKPELYWEKNNLTARVSAINATAAQLFHYLDCWKLLSSEAYSPLETMEIWDHTHKAFLHFDSADLYKTEMGFIIENRAIVKMLSEYLKNQLNVTFFYSCSPKQLARNNNEIILTLDNDESLSANLLVGADGAHSWVREQMTVKNHSRSYYHKAITGVIESQHFHNHCAFQKFLTTGPVALLPLANNHHTALVWSADNSESDVLMQKSDDVFSTALTEALDYKLGNLKLISQRSQFSLSMQHVDEYAENNIVLVGDAAHTIHPLAGLGVNLGLMDAASLTQILIEARNKKRMIGDIAILRKYTRAQKTANFEVISAMRGLKDCFAIDSNPVNFIRTFGINTLDQCISLKKCLMTVAMGKSEELPNFLQN